MGAKVPASNDERGVEAITAGLPTKSAKIRALDAAGYSRSEIAGFLGISYQHVRQVLVTTKAASKPRAPVGASANPGAAGVRPSMEAVVAGLDTKAARIRALHAAGYSRSEIARFLDIRYQHVRNVLIQEAAAGAEAAEGGMPRRQARISIGPGGRIAVPAEFWQALGVGEGDKITLELADDDGIRIVGGRSALERARSLVHRYVKRSVSLVDDLMAERRREAGENERGR
jgi:bifunctional DNA-binding transcriptional regulator/antitoxin component of YhaV-PrlF toxin-antitoxin module